MTTTVFGLTRDPELRAKDVQLAEHVLRWRIIRDHPYGEYNQGGFVRDDLTKVGHPPSCEATCTRMHSVPRYSSDPNTLLPLLAHMVKWAHLYSWEPIMRAERNGNWYVSFMRGYGVSRATLLIAVCDAALAARG